ncbi:hypothetical protein HDE_14437 [Halotydeus destructor]|nr:hypothetical protein HDE_14437 [Halotydeus destructor]
MKLLLVLALSTMVAMSYSQVSVDTSKTPDGQEKNVRVGVPFIVDLNLDRTNSTDRRNTKMDLGILGGFVNVNLDRTRDANGKRGPVSVSIFGQKVWGRKRR